MSEFHCALGYVLIAVPILYWVVIDIKKLHRQWSQSQMNLGRCIVNGDAGVKARSEPHAQHMEMVTLVAHNVSSNGHDSNESPFSPSGKHTNGETHVHVQNAQHVSMSSMNSIHSLRLESIENVLKPSNIFSWFGLMIISYIATRCAVNYLDWKRAFKPIPSDVCDILELCIRSFCIYILGNIAHRFGNERTKKIFLCYVCFFLMAYTVTYESCPDIEIGGAGFSNVASVILCIPFLIIATYLLGRNCYAAYRRSLLVRWVFFGGVIVLGMLQWLIVFGATQYIRIHIHHHYWALAMSLLCRSKDKASYVAQACLIAIFIHGITLFGCEDLFQWQHVDQSQFDEMCSEFVCPAWKCIMGHK